MRILKQICMATVLLVREVCLLPQTIANGFKEKRSSMVRNDLEAERLDRIRNPSKYRGK